MMLGIMTKNPFFRQYTLMFEDSHNFHLIDHIDIDVTGYEYERKPDFTLCKIINNSEYFPIRCTNTQIGV